MAIVKMKVVNVTMPRWLNYKHLISLPYEIEINTDHIESVKESQITNHENVSRNVKRRFLKDKRISEEVPKETMDLYFTVMVSGDSHYFLENPFKHHESK
ncbi:hypothetical protein [Vibrio phage phiKT1024]|nr:hypothetical protein [Vibrio phage phiKT1024]